MRTLAMPILALLSIPFTLASGAEKPFQAGPADQYPHQENEQITIGAKPFTSPDDTKPVFGKRADLNHYGVLPVLLVIKNARAKAIDLNSLEVKLVASGGRSVVPLEPGDVAALANPGKPPSSTPSPIPHIKRKNPLDALAIVDRAFVARMVPPGEQASGFFYFQAHAETGMRLVIQGIYERPSGKEILYFEIPL